jgi:DNA topoisomerase-6 subunit B
MSYQSTLGEGVAEELAESQQEISIAEFFERNRQMLGFGSGARGLVTAVKEAVDNALDAAEEAGILPDIYIEITQSGDYYQVVVEDNGPGITEEQVPKVFGKLLYGSRFHAREQNRGQQGIGISAAVLYAQLTSGKPARITSRTRGSSAQYFELTIDTETNEPEIETAEETGWDRPHGMRIELEMEANMRARSQLHEYVEHTAVVNPHARIELTEPAANQKYERATEELPDETEEIRPHPHGIELGTLRSMVEETDSYSVSGFLQEEFTRVGGKTADSVLDSFRDRHFGREMTWRPADGTADDVAEAVANKSAEATRAFAAAVADSLAEYDRVAHHHVAAVVDTAADEVAEAHGETFGATVREKATAAAWATTTERDPEAGVDRLTPDVYDLVDEATTTRKEEATVEGIAERIADRFAAGGECHRATRDDVADHVAFAADRTADETGDSIGETAREKIADAVWERMSTVTDDVPRVADLREDRDAAAELLAAMHDTDIIAPPTSCLSPITAELVEAGLREVYDAEFYAAATRDADVHGGDPFVVEAGIAYGGDLDDDGSVNLMRFANRVPLVYQQGACAITDAVTDIGWRNYGLDQPGGRGMPAGPCVLVVHVASTNVPFTSESKDAVANVPAIEDEVELAVREAARELKSFLEERRSRRQRRRKEDAIASILPQMAEKVAEVTDREPPNINDAVARIMNNVLVGRETGGGEVSVVVENHTDTAVTPEVTDIVSVEPGDVPEEATVVEMDGEWFVNWSPAVAAGETARLTYAAEDASFDLSVSGVDAAELTVDTEGDS